MKQDANEIPKSLSGTLKFSNPVVKSFTMTGYRFDGQSETLEVRIEGAYWRAYLSFLDPEREPKELIGSACGPFRFDIQEEIDRRGIIATEKPGSLFDQIANVCKPV